MSRKPCQSGGHPPPPARPSSLSEVQLPFDFRLEMADAVIQTSEQVGRVLRAQWGALLDGPSSTNFFP